MAIDRFGRTWKSALRTKCSRLRTNIYEFRITPMKGPAMLRLHKFVPALITIFLFTAASALGRRRKGLGVAV